MGGDWILPVSAGAALIGVGVTMMLSHRKAWRIQKNDPNLPDDERKHLYSRYRRRMQASGLLAALGVLIPVGVVLIPWQGRPLWWALYWGLLMLMSLWVVVLGLGDALSTAARSRAELGRIRRKQRELEQQIAELQRRKSNGRDST